MNCAMAKLCRFAASLIFATREGHCYPTTTKCSQKIAFKEGLSQKQRLAPLYPHVIHQQQSHVRGIDVLFVQRTTEAGFMPDSHVFPGGVLDEADYSTDWLKLFPADAPMDSLAQKTHDGRLPLYSNAQTGSVIGEIAFRICAIREAFEETGILLARPVESILEHPSRAHYQAEQLLVDKWRKMVCDDAKNFVQLFREIKCVPDIWSLVEWSNWFTPENSHRRYDTVFYLCCLEGKPSPFFNPSEVSKAEWLQVDEAIYNHGKQHITLPPPQVYELSIINMFPSLQHLHLYALYKSVYDNRICILPRRIKFEFSNGEDAMVFSLLPGDDLYPVETNMKTFQPSSEALRHVVKLVKSDNILYEFTSTVPSSSHLVSNNMLRILFDDSWKAKCIDTIQQREIGNIISDINSMSVLSSKL